MFTVGPHPFLARCATKSAKRTPTSNWAAIDYTQPRATLVDPAHEQFRENVIHAELKANGIVFEQGYPVLSHSAAVIAPFEGAWENSIRSDGVVFWDNGRGVFYNEHHICPTYWATYTVSGHTLVASDLNHHAPSRTMYLDSAGLLRERGTTMVYHRVKSVEFHRAAAHC